MIRNRISPLAAAAALMAILVLVDRLLDRAIMPQWHMPLVFLISAAVFLLLALVFVIVEALVRNAGTGK